MLDSEINDAFNYSPLTGELSWRDSRGPRAAGEPVRAKATGGRVCLGGRRLQPAHVAFYLAHGRWPKRVRFRDGNPRNWAAANLTDQPAATATGATVTVTVTPSAGGARLRWHGLDCGLYEDEMAALRAALELSNV